MGWNTGFTIMEQTVIDVYDTGKLDAAMLRILLAPYEDTDIDSGGCRDLKTKDGKGIFEVLVSTLLPDVYAELKTRNLVEDDFLFELYEEYVGSCKQLKWF